MKKIGTAFENFAFKAFDFSGRATLLEYWVVMPLIWALILFLLVGDVMEFWGMLLERRVPPLNPLYWDGILVFLVTIIPRLSLTVRRLHDSGKSGKWAKLPFVSLITSFWLVVGFGTAVMTSNIVNSDPAAITITAMTLFTFSGVAGVWESIFTAVAAVDAMGWNAVIAVLSEFFPSEAEIQISRAPNSAILDLQEIPALSSSMMLVAIFMIATPLVSALMHVLFMVSPGIPEDEAPGEIKVSGASLRPQGEVSANPFAGYRYLYERSPEQEAAEKEAARQEIRSIYQQRVLGQQKAT